MPRSAGVPAGPSPPAVRPQIGPRRRAGTGHLLRPSLNCDTVRGVETSSLITALDRAGYRLTEPRRSLAALIARRDGHFTAPELVAEARTRRLGVGRATVFRTLEVLEALGAVERLDLPSGEHAYVVCERAHHHHVICSRCGRTSEIRDGSLQAVVSEIARRTGYRVDTHRLELFGLCPGCVSDEPGPTTPSA